MSHNRTWHSTQPFSLNNKNVVPAAVKPAKVKATANKIRDKAPSENIALVLRCSSLAGLTSRLSYSLKRDYQTVQFFLKVVYIHESRL